MYICIYNFKSKNQSGAGEESQTARGSGLLGNDTVQLCRQSLDRSKGTFEAENVLERMGKDQETQYAE